MQAMKCSSQFQLRLFRYVSRSFANNTALFVYFRSEEEYSKMGLLTVILTAVFMKNGVMRDSKSIYSYVTGNPKITGLFSIFFCFVK